ncbi:MAG: hypothetical protein K0R57_5986 [Paenibacillaceae bacterium]|jgi:YD repeat-containing protein|nr:hypothetical protein [Paenibacillaceae bacterium]
MKSELFSKRFLRSFIRKKGKAAVCLWLALLLLATGVPFAPGPIGLPTKAHADTSLRMEPNRINLAENEKTSVIFSFNAADDGDTSHPTRISLCEVNPVGGFPIEKALLHEEDYPVKDGNGNYIEHRFEWDGTVNGVAQEGRQLVCVNPGGFDHGGTFYGYMASVDVYLSEQPQPPTSLKLENSSSGGGVLVRGIAEPGTDVTVEVWNPAGETAATLAEIPVAATGQWNTSLSLASNEISRIAAYASREGQKSAYSEITRALSYHVPAGSITWENAAGYYYKADTADTLAREARKLAADNGSTANPASAIPAGTRLLVKEPLAAGGLNASDAAQFTAEAVSRRSIAPRPGGGAGPVDPATGSFVFDMSNLSLQGLPVLSFAVSYNSRDSYAGALGAGWRHSFDWRITPGEDGKVLVSMPDGAVYEYVPLTGGGYLAPKGMTLELSRAGGSYLLAYPDGSSYTFSSAGVPVHFADANGNGIALTYEGNLLTQATAGGASLRLEYEGGHLVAVQDQTNRAVNYVYDADGHLTGMELPDGAYYGFTYDADGRISGVTKPESRTSTSIAYDNKGRVTSYTDEYGARTEAVYKELEGDDGGDDGGESGSGDTTIGAANSRDIAESDKVLLSGTMGNIRNAPAYIQVEGLKEAITPYMSQQKAGIETKLAGYEATAVSGGSSIASIQQAIAASGPQATAVVHAGGLNLEESTTFGSPSKPVVLIVDGINTNQPLQITLYGTLIIKGSLNANTKLSVAAHKTAATDGNLWVTGPVHLNNDSALQIDNQLYAGTLTYNNGLLDITADRVLVDGNLNINTKVDMNIKKEIAVGEIVSNNQEANLNVEQGDLFVREQVSVNNHF